MKSSFLFLLTIFLTPGLYAKEAPQCQTVRLGDIGWTDVSATTALSAEILKSIGYEPEIHLLSMPVTFSGLKNNDIDVFLGNWMPTEEADIRPYLNEKSMVQLNQNLAHAKYTLAVPDYVYEAGVHSFEDLARHGEKFSKKIYGIEAGNDGNRLILKMIQENAFGLSNFELIESNEQGMLVAVNQAILRKDWIVFLGWAPHPMNLRFKLHYLSGGDNFFGPNYGESNVYTVVRKNFEHDCQNLAQFFKNFVLNVDIENKLMQDILEKKLSPREAAQQWMGKNPALVMGFLNKVQTKDGTESKLAFKKYLFTINNFDAQNAHFSKLPLGDWFETSVGFLTSHFSNQFRYVSHQTEYFTTHVIHFLLQIPPLILVMLFAAFAFFLHRSFGLSLLTTGGLVLIINLGLWVETIQTLVLVLLAAFISAGIGIPIGVLAARHALAYKLIRPLLDLMQTIPTFVYLIPTLMLFGLGVVPGLLSTIVFAIAAPIRMTYLGLKGVPVELLETAEAFGASKWQRLFKIEVPFALPSILLGFTQCIMLSLSMVVISALVGAEGLGTPVVRALNTVNIKQGFEAGLAIVIIAILLDRIFSLRPAKERIST